MTSLEAVSSKAKVNQKARFSRYFVKSTFNLGSCTRRRHLLGTEITSISFLASSCLSKWAFLDTDTDPVLFNRVCHSKWATFHSNPKFFNHLGKFPVWKAAVIFLSLLYSYLRVLGPLLFMLGLRFLHLLHKTWFPQNWISRVCRGGASGGVDLLFCLLTDHQQW